ncbi:MAG: type II toxin-antitoxin system Phd/YefM family antitoxin [Pyrinomonadaceae bacterium]
MAETVTLQEAQARLAELVSELDPGEEVLITKDERPVAKLVGQSQQARRLRQPGSAKGKLFIHAEDDEHLSDFTEYMP